MARPINFPAANAIMHAPGYAHTRKPCCVHNNRTAHLTRWRLTLRERLSALLFGTVWIDVRNAYSQPAMHVTVQRNIEVDP